MRQRRWDFSSEDRHAVSNVLAAAGEHEFLRSRRQHNVEGMAPEFEREAVWRALVTCLLTTQQKSGAGSAVSRFTQRQPYPLSLAFLDGRDVGQEALEVLVNAGGIRRNKSIASELDYNFRALEKNGGWARLEEQFVALREQRVAAPDERHAKLERTAAVVANKLFKGIGPKQSRNFWQFLGLTRYEVPIDSRFMTWLAAVDSPLADFKGVEVREKGHALICEGIQALSSECGVLPCILDAAVFVAGEKTPRTRSEETIL